MEGGYHGHDGIRRWWAALLDTFPDFRAEIVELHDLGDLTVAVLRLRGHGAERATPVDATAWQVPEFRHGKCLGWRVYLSERDASKPRPVGPADAEADLPPLGRACRLRRLG